MSTKASLATSSVLIAWMMVTVAAQAAAGHTHPAEMKDERPVSDRKARICVTYTSEVDSRVFSLQTLVQEANDIWRRYGVTLEGWGKPCSDGLTTIQVRVRRWMSPGRLEAVPRNALGTIYFVAGRPRPLLDLWIDEAVRVIGSSPALVFNGASDAKTRVELARLLGRSLAHEIGHLLLGTGAHSKTGLMRPNYGMYDARTMSSQVYALDDDQVDVLQRTLTAWRQVPVVTVANVVSNQPQQMIAAGVWKGR